MSNWTDVESYQKQFGAKDERRLLSKIEGVMARQQADRDATRDTKHVHPSDLAKNDWCPRATYYKMTDETVSNPDSVALRRMNIFAEGHAIHEKWQKWLWMTGCLVGKWSCNSCGEGWMGKSPLVCPECMSVDIKYREVDLYDEDYQIIGHADGEWEDSQGRALIEIKSIGLGTIRWDAPNLYEGFENGELSLDELWKRIKRPLLPHRRQINLYMYLRKVDQAIVIYEWKPTQEVKEFHLSYDEALVKPMLEGAKSVVEAVKLGIAPDRPIQARKSGMCKFCPYKDNCWGSK